ncbi:MAG: DNA polymerase III subunit beta [Bacilli bacterium]|nr:DNA polymerase III subunit beta [Bacilli bacterium]MDD4077321.1 DNA polymerase III subunit beta [Bacilli bacterium]MDD4387826.1 DNA polymerase III subunit beta [Bacilli bacterium]
MKFLVNRDLLWLNLNNISRALSTKPPMPILTGIKIEARGNSLFLTASNNEISIQTEIRDKRRLQIEAEGVVVVPGKYFIEIVKKIEAKEIDISTFEDNIIKIIADRSLFSLNAFDKDNYPLISFNDSDVAITMDVLNLKQLIKKTTFAASLSESRVILTGISFTTEGRKMEVVATDSYRLAKKFMVFEKEYPDITAIIPSRSLDELNRIMDESESDVEIHFSPLKVLFKYKNVWFQSRLIDGKYPNTTTLIPTDFLISVKFNKNEMISAIERASLFTSFDSSNIVKLKINSDKTVEISSTNNEIGAVKEELIPLECSNLINFEIAFSSKYFLDALRVFDSTEVTIHFTGEIKPFIITGYYDVNLTQLILPVRIS